MRHFKQSIIKIVVMLMTLLLMSCKTTSQVPDSSKVSDSGNSISSVRNSFEKRTKEFFDNNEESLTIIAKAFLSTDYISITFNADSVEIWEKGLQPYEISIDVLDQDLYLYYSLVDPPFHEINRENPENSRYASTECAVIVMEYRDVSSDNVTIQALLYYGDNLAQSWYCPKEYSEKITEDWVLFFNYHEGTIR